MTSLEALLFLETKAKSGLLHGTNPDYAQIRAAVKIIRQSLDSIEEKQLKKKHNTRTTTELLEIIAHLWRMRTPKSPTTNRASGSLQRMVRAHSGDCTIYSAVLNNRPEDGICTCGYGWTLVREGDWSEMYSKERATAMSKR